jgi:hypothetical protein
VVEKNASIRGTDPEGARVTPPINQPLMNTDKNAVSEEWGGCAAEIGGDGLRLVEPTLRRVGLRAGSGLGESIALRRFSKGAPVPWV